MSPLDWFRPPIYRALAIALCSAGMVCSADGVSKKTSNEAAGPSVVALVNGEAITEAQILRRLKAVDPNVESHRGDPNRWARLRESATEAAIRDRLLLQSARAEGHEVSATEVSAALERSKAMLGAERFAEMLARQGADEADYRAFLGDRLMIRQYRAKFLGNEQIYNETLRDYYRGHRDSFRAPAQVRLEVVEIGDPGLAKRAAARLREGVPLATLADWDAGVRTRDDWVYLQALPPDVRQQVADAKPGDVIGPLRVAASRLRVVRLREGRPPRQLPFTEAKEMIRDRLLHNREQSALDAWYEKAKRNAEIAYP